MAVEYLAKPKDQKREKIPAVVIYPDGREVCQETKHGRWEYHRRIEVMLERQGWVCGLMISRSCKRRHGQMAVYAATFEHVDGRGMNGAHRDDRIEKDGKPYNLAACYPCNKEKGSRRL